MLNFKVTPRLVEGAERLELRPADAELQGDAVTAVLGVQGVEPQRRGHVQADGVVHPGEVRHGRPAHGHRDQALDPAEADRQRERRGHGIEGADFHKPAGPALVVVRRRVQALERAVAHVGEPLDVGHDVAEAVADDADAGERVRLELVAHQLVGAGVDGVHDDLIEHGHRRLGEGRRSTRHENADKGSAGP
jgi:hypothetical protein